jgi:hypothetical protein
MLTSITLTGDERPVVDDGQITLDQLLALLTGIVSPGWCRPASARYLSPHWRFADCGRRASNR